MSAAGIAAARVEGIQFYTEGRLAVAGAQLAQIASAREPWLTGALKSSPPPELILEKTISVTRRIGYITLVTSFDDLRGDYPTGQPDPRLPLDQC
jgi:hypothetical protein